ncbi:MAG: YeeE/YedE thiosulfate transporter family protein [Planctomycetota bacterium]|nr:YeeE/YedE thiosulfate transporter family protein [Planctomycetota bacterium]
MDLFPLGIREYIYGGLLVGAGVSLIFLTTGIISGASGFLTSTWSWLSRRPGFRQPPFVSSRVWRAWFTVGLIGGALAFTLLVNQSQGYVTDVQWSLLGGGGFLVGLGTRMSRGCTSGHGICGLSSWSLPSLLAVITFMGVAVLTANAIARIGVML